MIPPPLFFLLLLQTVASVPHHPVLKRVIELVVERLQSGLRREHKWWVWYHTGPNVWTWALLSMLGVGEDFATQRHCAQGKGQEEYDVGLGAACATEILRRAWTDPLVRKRGQDLGICLVDKATWSDLISSPDDINTTATSTTGTTTTTTTTTTTETAPPHSSEWLSRQFAQHASYAVALERRRALVNIPIYWINGSAADSYEDRKRELSMHIQLDGLEHYRVAAVRWDVDFIEKPNFFRVRDRKNEVFPMTTYVHYMDRKVQESGETLWLPRMGPAVACTGSHFKAIGLALSRGHPAALIMEDDMILDDLLPYWDKSLGALITELEHEDPDWEMIQIWSNHHYEHMEGGQQRPFSHVKRKVNHPLVGDSTGAYILSRKGMEKVISTYQGHVDAEGEVHGLIVRATTGHMVADIVIFEPLVNHMYIVRNPLVMHHCPRDSLIGGYLAGQLMFTDLSIAYQYELMAIPRPPSCVPREPQCGFACKLKGAILV